MQVIIIIMLLMYVKIHFHLYFNFNLISGNIVLYSKKEIEREKEKDQEIICDGLISGITVLAWREGSNLLKQGKFEIKYR